MDEDLEIRVKAKLDAGVKRTLESITADVKRSEKERAKASEATDKATAKSAAAAEKEKVKAASAAAKAQIRLSEEVAKRHVSSVRRSAQAARSESIARAREILEDFRKSEAKKRAELAKTLREVQMSEAKRLQVTRQTERAILREQQAAVRSARDARSGADTRRAEFRGRAMGAAAAAAGVVGTAASAVSRFAAAGGVRSPEQMLQDSLAYNRSLAALSAQSGRSADELRARINAVSSETGIGQMDLLEGLQMSQGRFGGIDEAVANLDKLARAAVGANASFGALNLAVGTAGEVYGLTAEEADNYLNTMISLGAAGSIEAEQFAEVFAPFAGVFQRQSGQSGLQGATNAARFGALMGTSYAGDSQALTLSEAALRQIGSMDVQERLALATGGRAVGRGANRRIEGGTRLSTDGSIGGQVADPLEAIRQIQALGLSPGQLQRILGDSNAVQGVGVIGTALNSEQGRAIMAASANDGRALVDNGVRAQESVNQVGMTFARQQAQSFADFQTNSRGYSDAVSEASSWVSELNGKYPLLSESMGIAKDAFIGIAQTLVALKMMAVGGGAAGAAGAAGATGAGVSGLVSGLGALAGSAAGVFGIPLAIGAAGMAIDSPNGGGDMYDFWGEQSDRNGGLGGGILSALSEIIAGRDDPARDSSEATRRAAEANTRALLDSARANQDLAGALRERAADTGGDTGLQ